MRKGTPSTQQQTNKRNIKQFQRDAVTCQTGQVCCIGMGFVRYLGRTRCQKDDAASDDNGTVYCYRCAPMKDPGSAPDVPSHLLSE